MAPLPDTKTGTFNLQSMTHNMESVANQSEILQPDANLEILDGSTPSLLFQFSMDVPMQNVPKIDFADPSSGWSAPQSPPASSVNDDVGKVQREFMPSLETDLSPTPWEGAPCTFDTDWLLSDLRSPSPQPSIEPIFCQSSRTQSLMRRSHLTSAENGSADPGSLSSIAPQITNENDQSLR